MLCGACVPVLRGNGGVGMDAIIQAIVSFIKMIRISDIVDIAIMSFLIYKEGGT